MSYVSLNTAIEQMVIRPSSRLLPIKYNSDTLFTSPDSFDLIGQGSFANVRRCYHTELKKIAVKYFHISGSKQSIMQKIQDAAKEALTLVNISHKNIVQVYGITTWSNYCGIIMEEIPSGSLEDLLFSKVVNGLTWQLRFRIVFELSNALDYLCKQKTSFVHGDLKPQNILLTENCHVKLSDFGSVAILQATGMMSSFNIPTNQQYTPFYSAPEVLKDITTRNCLSDIYSFAMIVYEIITCHRVFLEAGVSQNLILYQIQFNGQKPNMEHVKNVEKSLSINSNDWIIFLELKHVMVNCWHFNPSQRPTAAEVFSELELAITKQSEENLFHKRIIHPHFPYYNEKKESNITQRIPLSQLSRESLVFTRPNKTELLDYLSVNLRVTYKVGRYSVMREIVLKNQGEQTIFHENCLQWSIYFNDIKHLKKESFQTKNKLLVAGKNFEISHVDGTLYKITTTPTFNGLKPNENIRIRFDSKSLFNRSNIFPRWYVCAPGEKPKIIQCTEDNQDFVDISDLKRSQFFYRYRFLPDDRYRKYEIADFKKSPQRILPKPKFSLCTKASNNFEVADILIAFCKTDFFNLNLKLLSKRLDISPIVNPTTKPQSNSIKLKLDSVSGVRQSKDAYQLKLNSKKKTIKISALTKSGSFYAIQTLLSLIENGNSEISANLPSGVIKDAPRFDYRGLFLDVATHFLKLQDLLNIIKTMSMYKLNRLVLQLTNNAGWRIEIDGLPELTDVGSRREHSENEEDALYPAFGSGPYDNTSGSGFYSISDYKNILKTAAQHHVQIIPCILMPGQCHAAIVSMTKRYKHYMKMNDLEKATEYLLIDIKDTKTESNIYNYKNSLIDPSLDSTYNFIDHVIDSIISIHQTIQPLKIIYIGGYGLFHDRSFEPATFQLFKNNAGLPNDINTFHEYFMYKTVSISWQKYGIKLGTHANAILTELNQNSIKSSILPVDALVVFATNPSTILNTLERAYILANTGYEVVLSHGDHLFLEHAQEPDFDEWGEIGMTRFIDDKIVFAFKPDDIYSNCKVPLRYNNFSEPLLKPENIVGIQAYIYSDLIRDVNVLHSQLFPRLLPFAERAWHKASWEVNQSSEEFEKDWEEFANAVGYKELARLRKNGIYYRIPPPGIKQNDKTVQICSLYPGFRYMYRKAGDESLKWKDVETSCSLPRDKETYEFVTVDSCDQRKSKVVRL